MHDPRIREAYERIDPDAAVAERIWRRVNGETVETPDYAPEESVAREDAGAEAPKRELSSDTGRMRAVSGGSHSRGAKHASPAKSAGIFGRIPLPAVIAVGAVVLVLIIVLAISLLSKDKTQKPSPEPSYATPAGAASEDLSAAVSFSGPEEAMAKIGNVEAALKEWSDYKTAKRQAYYTEKLPYAGPFIDASAGYDGTEVEVNADETYTLFHWRYMENWSNTSISPVTGAPIPELTQVVNYEDTVTIDADEYANYMAYTEQLAYGGYGDYNYIYSVMDEQEAAKLEEIAAKYSLTLRMGEGTTRGFGEAADGELMTALTEAVGKGDIYTAAPQFDHFVFYDNGAFQSLASIALSDGRRMYTSICSTSYTEMVDGREAGGFTVEDPDKLTTRSYTAADGTELTVSQSETQAIIYAYLDGSYVVVDMSINPWRQEPAAGDSSETLSAKRESDFTLTDELVNYAADCINYSNIGK